MKTISWPVDSASVSLRSECGPTPQCDARWLIWKAREHPGSILEIGTHWGHMAYEFGMQFPSRRVFTIDYPGGIGSTMESEQAHECLEVESIGKRCRSLRNVEVILCPSQWVDYSRLNIGFVFIDGAHSFHGVREDTEQLVRCFARCLRPSPVCLVWHDYYNNDQGGLRVKDYLDTVMDPAADGKVCLLENGKMAYLEIEPCQMKSIAAKILET